MKNKLLNASLLIGFILLTSFLIKQDKKPTFFIIGDSTVKNGKGDGSNGLWGWGSVIEPYFNLAKINVENDALGGTSSRTFQTQGLWDKVLVKIHSGDFVMMQFGHNDSSPLDDTARARGTIKGVGDESKEIYNPITKKQEVVHTYGWYMSKFVTDAKAKGATVIICSPIPRNDWAGGKVKRNNGDSYGGWSKQVAAKTGVFFIDLNSIIADEYDKLGADAIKPFFPQEHTHTGNEGAELNAASVIKGLKAIPECTLNNYLK
jgi:rhamnogalacturonan acetylesterase